METVQGLMEGEAAEANFTDPLEVFLWESFLKVPLKEASHIYFTQIYAIGNFCSGEYEIRYDPSNVGSFSSSRWTLCPTVFLPS